MSNIIGCAGRSGSGKDALAAAFVAMGWVRVGLADILKRQLAETFALSKAQVWGDRFAGDKRNEPDPRYPRMITVVQACDVMHEHADGSECSSGAYEEIRPLTPRHLMQSLGTWGRAEFEDIWVKRALETACAVLAGSDYVADVGIIPLDKARTRIASGVVIPDVRYPNEVARIREVGGKVIRITRPGAGLTGEAAAHLSETALEKWRDEEFDGMCVNDGPIEKLQEWAKEWTEK